MKKLSTILLFTLFSFGISFAQTGAKKAINDGLYLIEKEGTDTTRFQVGAKNRAAVKFSDMFVEDKDQNNVRLLINTSDYVPLELEKSPETEQQTETKKKLLLSLTKSASEKLKKFTAKNVMKHVAVIVDGEALTMHRIKVAITSGQLQISRCNDNACELLFVKLKDNVKRLGDFCLWFGGWLCVVLRV